MKSYKVVEFARPLHKVEEANPASQGTEVMVRISGRRLPQRRPSVGRLFRHGGGNKIS